MEQTHETDLLQDFERELNLVPVSNWVRLGNFIIDRFAIYFLFRLLGIVIDYATLAGAEYADMTSSNYIYGLAAIQVMFSFLISIGYYTIFEGATNGRTIGKFVTRSVAVKENGDQITFKEALLRSLCRLIPFNAISALFGAPWHDSITRTTVVRKP